MISAETQQSVVEYNVFEGREVKGLPRYTLSRGEIAVDDGTVCATAGHGKFVTRAPYPEVNKALSKWKEVTAPRKVVRDPENMPACV